MITFKQLRKKLLKEEDGESGSVEVAVDGIENFSYDETAVEDEFGQKSMHHPKKQKASQQNNRIRYMSFHRVNPSQKAQPQQRGNSKRGKANKAKQKRKKNK